MGKHRNIRKWRGIKFFVKYQRVSLGFLCSFYMLSNFCCWRIFWIICTCNTFLNNGSISAAIMYYILSGFIYWLHSISDGIIILQKSLFLYTFFMMKFKFTFCLRYEDNLNNKNPPYFLKLFYVITRIFFYNKIMPSSFLFSSFGIIKRIYLFFIVWVMFLYISGTYFFFFSIQNIKTNCWIIFPKVFPINYICGIIYSFLDVAIYKWLNVWNSFWIPLNFSIV